MLRRAMDEDKKPPSKFILTDGLRADGNDIVPYLPHLTIHELGKQLLKASFDGNLEEISLLMSKGAPFSADWLGTSPLHLAAQNNHLEVVQVLLQAGMSRDARTKVDRTPLHMASYEGHLRIVECLLMNGADYDCKDLLNMTPLHWAAQNGHAEIADVLIRYGASTTVVNKFDLTPADIALQINRPDIAEIIQMSIRDPLVATQTIALELVNDNSLESGAEPIVHMEESIADEDNSNSNSHAEPNIPLGMDYQTIILEESLEMENPVQFEQEEPEETVENIEVMGTEGEEENVDFSESIKLLQQHGITMLPDEPNNILSSVMESGHSVVLTEAGKQALNSIKNSEISKDISEYLKPKTVSIPAQQIKKKKIITVTAEEFLAMTNNGSFAPAMLQSNILKQMNGKLMNPISKNAQVKRIVMKKNKLVPVSTNINVTNAQKIETTQDVQSLVNQLNEANKQIDMYKCKLMKSEMEVEKYKYQLMMIKKQYKISSAT